VIREDRELLAELARLNRAMPSFALRLMDGSADAPEQLRYAQQLIAAGKRLQRRAEGVIETTIEGEAVVGETTTFLAHTPELDWEP